MNLDTAIKNLPESPGVYQFKDSSGKIIYVGKAKNLKKRVNSYFSKSHDKGKTAVLVRRIHHIEHIVVDSEQDALLLENNLIKNYQPRYNVLLKDDKTFPWIVIKNETFPRVQSTRNRINDGSEYFGPFTSARSVKIILDLVQNVYKLRTCSLSLDQDNILSGKYKPCLQYHIGNCNAPCIQKQSSSDYEQNVTMIRKILKGNLSSVIQYLKIWMNDASERYEFEQANQFKEKLQLIKNFQSKSTVVSTKITNIDVFSLIDFDPYVYVNYLRIIEGSIIQAHTLELKRRLNESKEELLRLAITEIRNSVQSNSTEIIIPFQISYPSTQFHITVPKQGEKKELLELSARNAKLFGLDKKKSRALLVQNVPHERILKQLQSDLSLSSLPTRIECFDNSNIQGSNPVAACVVFINAKPAKKEYRHYHIKSVEGANDFASMEEVIFRRFNRLQFENKPLPQLIVIDGGKGQLNAAIQSLEKLGLRKTIAIIGIAKRLEEIFFPDDQIPLYIDKSSESLKLIQQLRNEAHRFAIEFHRKLRNKTQINSELEAISGIGEKTIAKLLQALKPTEELSNLSLEQLSTYIPTDKAKLIVRYFQSKL